MVELVARVVLAMAWIALAFLLLRHVFRGWRS